MKKVRLYYVFVNDNFIFLFFSMHYIEINWKKIWPYIWIKYPDWKIVWDILPIIYDEAIIKLDEWNVEYALCYKVSKNLMGQDINYADLVNLNSWETFSYQVNNIFFLKIIDKDPKVIALVWKELKLFENFSKTAKNIEIDWDKQDITPLWYFDMYISYDDDYYYPEVFNNEIRPEIERFYDYYWYKSYVDSYWQKHLVMLLETEDSRKDDPRWYFFDNFKRVSEVIRFTQFIWDDSDEYVEDWYIDDNFVINFRWTTSWWYHIDPQSWKIKIWKNIFSKKSFLFTRAFEDTDMNIIVWKNENWYFLIDRTKDYVEDDKINNIRYFEKFIKFKKVNDFNLFLFLEKSSWDVIVVDETLKELYYTDLAWEEDIIVDININNDILEVKLKNWEIRKYFKN